MTPPPTTPTPKRERLNMGELLPCPFCGAKPCEDIQNGYIQKADGSFYQHVWCDTCNASGGEFKTAEEAIERWNTRPRTEGRGEEQAGLDAPLPCDVSINHITYRQGVSLRTLVEAATRWHTRASEAFSAPPIREPEISREAVEVPDEIEMLRIFKAAGCRTRADFAKAAAKSFADAILNLAPVAKGASQDAELSAKFDRPGRLSDATRHSAEGAADPALSGARGVVAPVGGRGEEGSSRADLSPASRSPEQHSAGGEG